MSPDAIPTPDRPTETREAADPAGVRWPVELAAAAASALVAAVLALAPHLTMLARHGSAEYVADNDEVFYLSVARAPYYGEAALRDPYSPPWQPLPSLYAWCQFVPGSWLTRALGLGPVLTSLVWRGVGGLALGPALYLLFRRLFTGINRPVAWALGCTLVCLGDAGFVEGRSVLRAETLVRTIAGGPPAARTPNAMAQYRVVSPLTNLPPLLVLTAVMVPVGRRGVAAWAAGSAALGLCVGLYFFMWTGAVAGMGIALGVWLLVWALARGPEAKARARTEFALGAAVLAGGLAIGSPQILSNARASVDPELKPVLQRLSRGQVIPPGHPGRTRFVKNYWAVAKVTAGAGFILLLGPWGRRLVPVWATTLGGYLLLNSAAVTGLEFENFHWLFVAHPLGEVAVLGGLVLFVRRLAWPVPKAVGGLLWLLPAGLLALAAVFRPCEAVTHPEAVWTNDTLRALTPVRPALEALKRGDVLAGPREANVALLLGNAGQLFQFNNTTHASPISDAEVHERHALNGWLMGLSIDEYLAAAAERFSLSDVTRPEWTTEAVTAARRAVFEGLLADPAKAAALLDEFRPDALLRPAASGPPPRGGPWTLTASGGAWSVWSRSYPGDR